MIDCTSLYDRAKGRSLTPRWGVGSSRSLTLRIAAVLLLATSALAAPTGEEVINGEVTFHQDGSVTVITASDGAIIHYDSFDIFANEVVQFIQPGESARVLNRVSGDLTTIKGTLLANGIVYIVNPAGIFIEGDAVVEVGGLVAAAGNITNEDFLAGIDAFELTGSVVNESDDIRGEVVALLGDHVANYGEISAPDGVIALVAGDRVVLARLGGRLLVEVDGPQGATHGAGVVQAGLVDAGRGQVILAVGDHYSLAINHEGVTRGLDVDLKGGDGGLILVQGEIDATGDDSADHADQTGGSIDVIGDRIALIGATLDASGSRGGGSIHIGGQLRGEGESARRTFVDADSVLRADATVSGDGGQVVVWGDEAAVFAGSLSARGGDEGGDGGFAEISSDGLLVARGEVDLGAPKGESGTLLFDPQEIVIHGGTLDGDDTLDTSETNLDPASILFEDDLGSDPFHIYESEIEGTDANIVLEATHGITLEDEGASLDGVVVLLEDNSLTLRTRNAVGDDVGALLPAAGIDLGSIDWQTSGDGDITIATGVAGEDVDAGIRVGDLTSVGGVIDVSTSIGAISVGDVDSSGADGDTGGAAGIVRISAVAAGDVSVGSISATGGTGSMAVGGAGARVTVASGDGSVDVVSIDASGGDGASNGGNAGSLIVIQAGDADGSGTSAVMVSGDLTSRGGMGAGGNGGSGGRIDLLTLATPVDPPMDDEDPPDPIGGGPITVLGGIDTSGGDGSANGGGAGRVSLVASVSGDIEANEVLARGGNADTDGTGGPESGGDGASIFIATDDGAITAGALETSGGDGSVGGADPTQGARGRAARIELRSGRVGSGDIMLLGAIDAVDGEGDELRESGGLVLLIAAEDLEFMGVAGPQIRTSEQVQLVAGGSIGAVTPVEIDAVDLIANSGGSRELLVEAGGTARVDVTTAGFDRIVATAASAGAFIDITQVAGDSTAGGTPVLIDIDGDLLGGTSTIVAVDSLDPSISGGVEIVLQLQDRLEGDDDEHVELVVSSGAIESGGFLRISSEDDVILEEDAIAVTPVAPGMLELPTAPVLIAADLDADGDGAIAGSGAGTHIDMNTDGVNPTASLGLQAASGVGSAGAPVRVIHAETLAAGVVESGGIHIEQTLGGDLSLVGGILDPSRGFAFADALAINAGDGDIDVENQDGNLLVFGTVRAAGDAGAGGSIRLAATDADTEVRFSTVGGTLIDAAGAVEIDGTLVLTSEAEVRAGDDVTFTGTVDSQLSTLVTQNLTVTSTDGVVRFQDDVGATLELRNLRVEGATEIDPTSGSGISFAALQEISFMGDVNAAADDAASMSIAAELIEFGADVGTAGRLTGLSLDAASIRFEGDGQTVVTGADGIGFNTPDGFSGAPPLANISARGDLRLESLGGSVDFGPNQKLTVDGIATLVGDTVIVSDVNAHEIHVDGEFLVRAREGDLVFIPGLGHVPDVGTDLFANLITTTDAPTAIGSGEMPRFATLSGSVGGLGGPGTLPVIKLSRPIESTDLIGPSEAGVEVFFDLALGVTDPGHESQARPVELLPLLPARPGAEASAGSAAAPSAEALLSFLRCADASPDDPRSCAPADGSPLDSERGDEIARRYRRLFGSSTEAEAARRLMSGGTSERSGVLRDTATFLAQLRLLGLSDASYERLRDQLLEEAVGAERREATLADVRGHARGLPL